MDSLTQIVLGAGVAEAMIGHKVGNKALLWGAILGTVPDLDRLSLLFMDVVDSNHVHRGFSHSILFFVLAAPLFGYLLGKIHARDRLSLWEWSHMSFWALFTHALLDAFTTWGTKLFWPFSDYPVAFKTIFVVDPLYTVPFLVCMIAVLFLLRGNPKRKRWVKAGLWISSGYLLITVINKQVFNALFEAQFEAQQLDVLRYETKPTPINNILWTANAEVKDGYYIGYRSYLDSDPNIQFSYFPKNHDLLKPVADHPKVQRLLELTNGFYTVEAMGDTLKVNDLRFGQYTGWQEETGGFVFAYTIAPDPGNSDGVIIEEVPRNPDQFRKMSPLFQRIMGN